MAIRVKGLKEFQKRLKDPQVLDRPMRTFYRRANGEISRHVHKNFRRYTDTGESAASVRHEVDRRVPARWGRVYSDKFSVRMLESGTKPHFPKVDGRLQAWAEKRGLDPYAVARGIAKTGTRKRRIFGRARFASRKRITLYSQAAAADMARLLAK